MSANRGRPRPISSASELSSGSGRGSAHSQKHVERAAEPAHREHHGQHERDDPDREDHQRVRHVAPALRVADDRERPTQDATAGGRAVVRGRDRCPRAAEPLRSILPNPPASSSANARTGSPTPSTRARYPAMVAAAPARTTRPPSASRRPRTRAGARSLGELRRDGTGAVMAVIVAAGELAGDVVVMRSPSSDRRADPMAQAGDRGWGQPHHVAEADHGAGSEVIKS